MITQCFHKLSLYENLDELIALWNQYPCSLDLFMVRYQEFLETQKF